MLLYNKRGELTSQQIVLITILIVSFIIIILFLVLFNFGGESKEEICQNSVLLKGKSIFPDAVSLDCHTQYICFSKTKSCDKMTTKPDEIIQVKKQREVYEALATKMAECWRIWGEGDINYIGSEAVPDFYCSICNQIYFDTNMIDIFPDGKFSQKGVYDYIVSQKYSEKEEFDEFLYNLNFSDSDELLRYFQGSKGEKANQFMDIYLDKTQLIVMGIWSDVSQTGWFLRGASAIGLAVGVALGVMSGVGAAPALMLAVAAIGAKTVIITSAIAGGVFAGVVSNEFAGVDFLHPIIIEERSDYFEGIQCEHIVTLS